MSKAEMLQQISSNARWAVLACLLAGGAVRLAALDAQSFWYDEAFTANIAKKSTRELLTGQAKDNGNPPLYWVMARGWSKLFGTSEAAWRSLPALCSTLVIPFVFLVARRLGNERAGLIAAFLSAISPCSLELADEARCYALLQFLAVLATWLYLRWYDSPSTGRLALYSVSIAAIALTHYYGFAVPVVHGAALLVSGADRRRIVGFLVAMLLAAALFAFWIPVFFAQLGTKGNLARMSAGWKMQFLGTPIVLAFGRMLAWKESPTWQLAGGTMAALAFVWIPAFFGIWHLRRDRFGAMLLSGMWLLPIVGPFVVAVLMSPIYATRYGTVGLSAFVILAGIGLANMRRPLATAALCGATLFSLISISHYFTRPIKPDWRQATAAAIQSADESEPIVIDAEFQVVPFRFYLRDSAIDSSRVLYAITSIEADDRWNAFVHRGDARPVGREQPIHDELLSQSAFTLVLCESLYPLEKYRELFGAAGYVAEEPREFFRIASCRFVRMGSTD